MVCIHSKSVMYEWMKTKTQYLESAVTQERMHRTSRLQLQCVTPGQTQTGRLNALLLRPWADWIFSYFYRPDTGLVPKCAVCWNMEIGLNGLSLEGKSNSEKEDKQVSRVIWFIWLSQVAIHRQFGVLTPYHLSFHFPILVLIFSYLYL